MKSRSPISLTEYRAALLREGEITIGAYARAQRRRRIAIGVIGALLIGGAITLYITLRPKEPIVTGPTMPVYVECISEGCGFKGVLQVEAGKAQFPMICPQCDKRACQKIWVCRDCGARVPHRVGEDELRCPECGSLSVGTAEEPPREAPN